MTFTIVHLFPELLGTYGDRGNADLLAWRLRERDIDHEVLTVRVTEKVPKSADLYLLGGGEDDAQIAAKDILQRKNVMQKILEREGHIFAVCAGFQILGSIFPASAGRVISGLGVLPMETLAATPRSVGEVLLEPTIELSPGALLTGFENHGGQTRFLSPLQPLGKVIRGNGNGLATGVDGVVTSQIIGTYMHGPALVRNPELADWILARKLGPLSAISAPIFKELHEERVRAIR